MKFVFTYFGAKLLYFRQKTPTFYKKTTRNKEKYVFLMLKWLNFFVNSKNMSTFAP